MKFLLVVLMIPFSAQAALKFAMERSTSLGTDKMEVHDENGTLIVKKTSNWFDRSVDTRLGEFAVQNPGPLKAVTAELGQIESEIKAADQRLAAIGKGFNELNNNDKPHAPFFRVNGFKVQQGSSLYPRLEEIAAKLQAAPLKLVQGVELDKSRKNYVFYADGKEVKREPFNARFFCESSRFPTRCLAREWGALYLE